MTDKFGSPVNDYLFEVNPVYTRESIKKITLEYLSKFNKFNVEDHIEVICDETNNTEGSISRNELHINLKAKTEYGARMILAMQEAQKSDD